MQVKKSIIKQKKKKKCKDRFLGMLLGTLRTSFLRNMLAGKSVIQAAKGAIRVREGFNVVSSFS